MTTAFNQNTLPYFSNIKPEEIEPTIRSLLTKNRQKLTAILAQPKPYIWENLMQPIDDMNDELMKTWAPIAHLHAVLESESLRQAYHHCIPLITEYHTELAQNEALFQAIQSLTENSNYHTLNPAQRKVIENDIRDFKLAGVHLPAIKKAQFAELEKKLSEYTTKFSENLLDATHAFILHITDSKQLTGLPQDALQLAAIFAKQRSLPGFVITLDYPSYSTAIKFLQDRNLRKTLYEAYATRASDRGPYAGKWDNTKIMETILQVRHELAKLVDFNNYAEYSLATKMAKTPDEVLRFLVDLLTKTKSIAEQELAEVVALAKRDGITSLEIWDLPYYSEKLRETKFHFSQEDLRPYFPINKVLAGMFMLAKQLYGITIREQSNIVVWHPDVRFFAIYDEQERLRGGFYIDLYAREHKRDGAWMDECRVRRRLHDKDIQLPVAFLTCNFMPPVDHKPALLTHDDVLTIFHEFGHCLHHLLTQVEYASVSGINGIPWDAIEFPSQFMENWCWEKEVLDLIAAHYETEESLPEELYQKLLNAKYFQTGLRFIRQLELALFDFRLHLEYDSQKLGQIQAILDDVRKTTSVINVPDFNRFQHSFAHIFAGGYAAGYYSYKWAEVLSSDAYEKFAEKKSPGTTVVDSTIGRIFLKNILEVGGVRDPLISFIAFRGREPKIDALLKYNGIHP